MTKKYGGKTDEQFKQEVEELLGEDYTILSQYKNNKTSVKVFHKVCETEYEVTPQNLLKGSKCKVCLSNKKRKTTEEFKQEVYGLVGYEYSVIGKYMGNKTNIKMHHNICDKDFEMSPNMFLRGQRCSNCNRNFAKTTNEWENEVKELTNGEYETVGEYINNKTHVKIKHNLCGTIWSITPKAFLVQGQRCPTCAKLLKVKSQEEFNKEFYELSKGEYKLLSDYVRSNQYVKVKHVLCGCEYNVTPNTFLDGCRCPNCSNGKNSKNVVLLQSILDSSNIEYKKELRFDDCKDKTYLFFDFAIFKSDELYCLIEVDGEQHFSPVKFGDMSQEEAEYQYANTKKRDAIKDDYCKSRNIQLIRIPYWEFDNYKNIYTIMKDNNVI